MTTMGHKIVAEAARRLAPAGGAEAHRHDLFVADNRGIASDTQRMLVGWSSLAEIPAVEALENFVLGQFNGMVKMDHASLRYYPDERVASLVVSWQSPTRRVEDAKKMARVAPDRYLEQGTKQIWEVRKAEDGTPFLVRKTEEDLDTLLSERRKKAAVTHKGVTASFATLRSAGYLTVDEGDTVAFTYKGLTKMGRVQRFDADDNVYIKSGEQVCKVAAPAITEVVQKDPKTIQDYKAKSRAYFSKIFPAKYMKQWMKAGAAEDMEGASEVRAMRHVYVYGDYDKIRQKFKVESLKPSGDRQDKMELHFSKGSKMPKPGQTLEVWMDGSTPYAMAPRTASVNPQ